MSTVLIDLLSGREVAEAQAVAAFQDLDAIIEKVYKALYGSLEPTFMSVVDFDHFSSRCFGLLDIHVDAFPNDEELKSYVWVAFENLLSELAKALTPGLATRQKQVQRVLKQTCASVSTSNRWYWQLKSKPDAKPVPGTDQDERERLEACAKRLHCPEPRYTLHADAARQPAYSDKEVQQFLVDLIASAGGMVSKNGLLNVVKDSFGLTATIIEPITRADGDEYAGGRSAEWESDNADFMSMDALTAAKQLIDVLTPDQREILYRQHINGMKPAQIQAELGFSQAKISNINKKIQESYRQHLDPIATGFSEDEIIAVVNQVYRLIVSEKEGKS